MATTSRRDWWGVVRAGLRVLAQATLVLLASAAAPSEAAGATFVVNTTSDSDDGTCNAAHCSLREAITAAQNGAGADTITFNIPGTGVRTLALTSCLPGVSTPVTIDGYTQPGSSPNTNASGALNAVPLIEIKGSPACSSTGFSVVFNTATLTVRGLVVSGFSTAILGSAGATVRVEGSFVGTTPDGMAAASGTSFDASGNGIFGEGTLIVGGTAPAARNLVAGNRWGIAHANFGTSVIQGNLIGTNKLGTAAVPNGYGYISWAGCSGGDVRSEIGGATAAARNIVSGNGWGGVSLGNGAGVGCGAMLATNSFVKGNYLGTDVTGTQPIPNGTAGPFFGVAGAAAISVSNGPSVTIGGTAPGEGNLIAFNSRQGVLVQQSALNATDGTRILGNRIFGNGDMGIDLVSGSLGVTPNDAGDGDLRLQNFPVITAISRGGASTTIQGTLNSQANRTYRIELFVSDAVDTTSHGEGQTVVGTTEVTTNGSGNGSFSVVVPAAITNLQYVTATATSPEGNTSEFSQVDADLSLTHADTPDPAATGQDVTYTFTVANTGTVFPSGITTLAYTRFASATLVDGGGGTTVGAVTTFTLPALPPGASVQRSVVVRYAVAGPKNSSATVTAGVIDPVSANNTTTPSTLVSAAPAVTTVSISGTVRTGINTALPGATLTLSGAASATTVSAANGTYSFDNLPTGGSFTISPSLAGRAFEPVTRTVTSVTTNQTGVDFVGRLVYTISGQVRDRNDTGVPGVTMTLSGSQSATLTTDLDGRYAFSGLVAGGTYTVSPARPTFVFNPPSQTFPNLAQDEVASFFIAQEGTFTRYFAEGATGAFFDTRFALLNATGTPASATVRFQRPAPAPEITTTLSLDGLERVTVDPKAVGLTSGEFSTVIESTQPLLADRTMTWDARGYGSHAETSIGRPLTQWFLAEGATIGGFDLFYLVQNPNPSAAQVQVRYLLPTGAPIDRTYTVAPQSRFNIWVNLEDPRLDDAEVSAAITADLPVIVERAMYRPVNGQDFGAGHESAGVEAPQLAWYFAEGATGDFFDLFFLIANPSGTSAQVEATYLKPDGSVVTKAYTVPATSRFNIWVDYEGAELASTAVATTFRVTNNVPVVIERAMWWAGASGSWYEGHNTAGATAIGEKWGLAEGEVGGPRNLRTYVLVANTSPEPGSVRVTLTFEDGSPQVARDFAIRARSRLNVDVGVEFPESVGRRFGAIVESVGTDPVPIMVERAMYNDADGVTWAAGTSALATRLR